MLVAVSAQCFAQGEKIKQMDSLSNAWVAERRWLETHTSGTAARVLTPGSPIPDIDLQEVR